MRTRLALHPDAPEAQLIALWLHGCSAKIQGIYGRDVVRFRAAVATTGRHPHARPSDSSARYLGV
jgi:hypothetical protein